MCKYSVEMTTHVPRPVNSKITHSHHHAPGGCLWKYSQSIICLVLTWNIRQRVRNFLHLHVHNYFHWFLYWFYQTKSECRSTLCLEDLFACTMPVNASTIRNCIVFFSSAVTHWWCTQSSQQEKNYKERKREKGGKKIACCIDLCQIMYVCCLSAHTHWMVIESLVVQEWPDGAGKCEL